MDLLVPNRIPRRRRARWRWDDGFVEAGPRIDVPRYPSLTRRDEVTETNDKDTRLTEDEPEVVEPGRDRLTIFHAAF